MTGTFVEGEEVGRSGSGDIVRFIGYSRKHGFGVGLDVATGDLYVAESLQPFGERVSRVPETPQGAPGTAGWAAWGRDCFALAPSLGEADWVISSDWASLQESDDTGDGGDSGGQ
jgi:hypothetical protein